MKNTSQKYTIKVKGALLALLLLGVFAPTHAGRGGGIAAGVFGGMLAGSMISNAMNNRDYGNTTYYVESPAPVYYSDGYANAQPSYGYTTPQYPQYASDYGSGYNNPTTNNNDEYEQQLAGLAGQNKDLREKAKGLKAQYDDLKNQYDRILAAGREYKRKFLSLERKYNALEREHYDLQLRCDELSDTVKKPATRIPEAAATPQEPLSHVSQEPLSKEVATDGAHVIQQDSGALPVQP